MNKRSLYWLFQVVGWLLFIVFNGIFIQWTNGFNSSVAFSLFLVFFLGVLYSHLYRSVILKFNWLRLSPVKVLPLVIISTLILSVLSYFTQLGIESILREDLSLFTAFDVKSISDILTISFQFFLWSLIYFLFHFIGNYKKAEIENLKWQASINEIELNKLKSQLNPHFIFNSMNSIRALVDEEPSKAKDAITQLSSILRSTLLMGKKKVISFGEELAIVKDYLDLESTRLEERLKIKIDIDPGSEKFDVPPLMIQTLVENGIKHGVSKLVAGGELSIITKINPVNSGARGQDKLHIHIRNSGKLIKQTSTTGFGIKNTVQRLQLLFGKEASFSIENENETTVHTQLIIPKTILP